MENKRFGLGVFVCVFNRDFSKIMLILRNEEKRKKWNADWGNVGGKIEFREKSIDACIREAKEEMGVELKAENLRIIEVKETPYFHEIVHGIHFIYATTLDEDEKITINEEAEGYKWFDLNNLPDRMIDKKEDILRIARKAKEIFQNEK
ncbi:MAG: NUDIX hydrolase [Nanoarchaeota archaeon]|nr:NUDIX hydrolase [Nanoarchaeota archaeon]